MRLTRAAADDLLAIATFGIERFGTEAARAYYQRLVERLEAIAANPSRYPRTDHLRPGYRRSVCGIHSIYYRIADGSVEIVRVLGRQDPASLRSS